MPGNTQTYASAVSTNREYSDERLIQLTQVLSNKAVNEIKGGEAVFGLSNQNLTTWSNHWQKINGINTGSPRITFKGFSIGGNQNYPRHQDQWVWNVRDDFTYSYDAKGRHDLRTGAEFLNRHQIQDNCRQCMGTVTASSIAAPTPAQMQAWFPDPFNADTWNLAAISPWVTTYDLGVGDFNVWLHSKKGAAWAQDDWAISDRMTLNLGLRYDLEIDPFANHINFPPFQSAGRPLDKLNIQPRLGFNYKLNDRTVLRGGAGLYYGDAIGADQSFASGNPQVNVIEFTNDGRPDFAANPLNGAQLPTYAQATAQNCSGNPAVFNAWKAINYTGPAPCLTRALQEFVGLPQHGNPPAAHVPDLDRLPASAQHVDGGRIRLRLVPRDAREGRRRQHQPDVRPEHGPEPAVLGSVDPSVRPDWGVVSMNTHLGRSEVPRCPELVDEAVRQALAGVGDLHAVVALQREYEAVQRSLPDDVPHEQRVRSGEWGLLG